MPKLDDVSSAPLPQLPPRRADSHKGDFGRALVVGGSSGMSGAVSLTGRATLRSGAGLVTLAVPKSVQNIVAAFEPSYMTHALADDNGQIAKEATTDVLSISNAAIIAARFRYVHDARHRNCRSKRHHREPPTAMHRDDE